MMLSMNRLSIRAALPLLAGALLADGAQARAQAYESGPAYGAPHAVSARIWLDRGHEPVVQRGDRLRLYYRTSADAYVAIFKIDPNGSVHLLHPSHPGQNHYVRGGRDYRLLFPGSSYWHVNDYPGMGYFFIVASPRPFDFSRFQYYGSSWDLSLAGGNVYSDPYVAMDDYVAQLVPNWQSLPYALDFATYHVGSGRYDYPRFVCYDCHGFRPYSTWNPYHYRCTSFRIVIYNDPYYYPAYRYRGSRVVFVRPPVFRQPRFAFKERADGESFEPLIATRASSPPVIDRPGVGGSPGVRRARPEDGSAPPTATGRTAMPRTSPSGRVSAPPTRSGGAVIPRTGGTTTGTTIPRASGAGTAIPRSDGASGRPATPRDGVGAVSPSERPQPIVLRAPPRRTVPSRPSTSGSDPTREADRATGAARPSGGSAGAAPRVGATVPTNARPAPSRPTARLRARTGIQNGGMGPANGGRTSPTTSRGAVVPRPGSVGLPTGGTRGSPQTGTATPTRVVPRTGIPTRTSPPAARSGPTRVRPTVGGGVTRTGPTVRPRPGVTSGATSGRAVPTRTKPRVGGSGRASASRAPPRTGKSGSTGRPPPVRVGSGRGGGGG